MYAKRIISRPRRRMSLARSVRWFLLAVLFLCLVLFPTRQERHELYSIGFNIYGYHERTGRWPTKTEDISSSFSEHLSNSIREGKIVVVWRVSLQPTLKQNPDAILAYEKGGIRTWLGLTDVCWGDLRTDVITEWQLQRALAQASRP